MHLFGKKKAQNPYLAYFPFFFSKPYLQEPQRAIAYLNGALAEGDPEFFLLALQNVAQAREKAIDFSWIERASESGELLLDWHRFVSLLKDLELDLTVKETSQVA